MGLWTDIRDTARFKHVEDQPSWLRRAQKWSNMPGSPVSLMAALERGEWSNPYSSGQNSYDTFAGGGSATKPWARGIGRAVGSFFAGSGISDVSGVSGLGGQVMKGLKGGGGGLGGMLSGLGGMGGGMGGMMGGGGGGGGGGYDPLIPPYENPSPDEPSNEIPPGLLAALLSMQNQQQPQQQAQGPMISSGGFV